MYQDKFMSLDLYNDSYDHFLELITKPNATVLEIGCGPGNITQYLLNKKTDLKITGIDIAENMVALAKKNNPTADFVMMDCREIGGLNKKFDAIVCGFCVPYLSKEDCEKLMADCNDLLRHSGILYLSFVAGDYENSGYMSSSTGDRTYFYYHNLNDLVKTLESNQLAVHRLLTKNYTKADGSDEIHTIIISKKTNAVQ